MNQALVTKYPITDRVKMGLATTLRGCEELIPENDWIQKLAKSEATGVPLRIKLAWIRPHLTFMSATPWC